VPVIKRDIVYVPAKADTIYITKVVYKASPPVQQPVIISANAEVSAERKTAMGVSMKEKEELDNLLVSGSE
jgi:hypothetical protein